MQNEKLSAKKYIKSIILVLIIVVIISSILKILVFDNRIVGYVEGQKLYYKGEIYDEYFNEIDPFTGFGASLGKVTIDDGETKRDLLPLKGQTEYLHVSFGWDGRNYKRSTEHEKD